MKFELWMLIPMVYVGVLQMVGVLLLVLRFGVMTEYRIDRKRVYLWLFVTAPVVFLLLVPLVAIANGLASLAAVTGVLLVLVFAVGSGVLGFYLAEIPGFIVGTVSAMIVLALVWKQGDPIQRHIESFGEALLGPLRSATPGMAPSMKRRFRFVAFPLIKKNPDTEADEAETP